MKPFRSVLLCLFTLFGCLHQAMAAKVLNVRSYRAPEYTRLVFDLDAPLQYQLETRAAPDRLVINLKKSMLVGPLDKLSLANTPITKITSAQNKEHDVRVELALDRKVEARGFTLGKNEQYGDRLVIDLYDAVAKTASDGGATADPIGALSASLVTSGKRDIVVAISAGHGGKDTGAIGVKQLEEKQVTLAISREVTEQLGRISGFKAVLIRKGDYYVGLREQINMAHDQHADLFIAIHADAADNKTAKGATVYALSTRGATSELALRQADKENSADLIGGVGTVSLDDKDPVLASVLVDFSMTAQVASSLEIGQRLITSLDQVTHMRRTNVEQAAFVVLKSADIPSLLVESAYITNKTDAENLDSPAWRKKFAGALVDGITQWFENRPPRGTLIAWQKEQDSAPSFKQHTIARGETLSEIASSYDVPVESIRATNQLKSDNIRPGQVLKIPAS